jgi:hypothetical protein
MKADAVGSLAFVELCTPSAGGWGIPWGALRRPGGGGGGVRAVGPPPPCCGVTVAHRSLHTQSGDTALCSTRSSSLLATV